MKRNTKWFAGALALTGGLAMINSAQAQLWQTPVPAGTYTTTVLSDFANFNLSATYGNWDASGWMAINGGAGIQAPVITSGSTPGSYEVNAAGYGSGAYNFPTAVDATGAWYGELTLTVNDGGNGVGSPIPANMNPQFDINSDGAFVAYPGNGVGGGPGYVSGQTYTLTVPLNAAAAAALGETLPGTVNTSVIYGFNLENASYANSPAYDVTYDSFVLLTPTPEPTTLALIGLGAAGLMAARRRVKAS